MCVVKNNEVSTTAGNPVDINKNNFVIRPKAHSTSLTHLDINRDKISLKGNSLEILCKKHAHNICPNEAGLKLLLMFCILLFSFFF